jgi:hypothetical protein
MSCVDSTLLLSTTCGARRSKMIEHCPRCNWPYEDEDVYCRHCGRSLISSQLPVVFSRAPLPERRTTPRTGLMTVPQRALAVGGGAAVGLGLLSFVVRRWLVPKIERRLGRSLVSRPSRKLVPRAAEPVQAAPQSSSYEQIIWIRRIIIRR